MVSSSPLKASISLLASDSTISISCRISAVVLKWSSSKISLRLPPYFASFPTLREGKEEGGVASRLILAADREIAGEKWELSDWVRSEPVMDMVSPYAREVVRTEELLRFLDKTRLKILDVFEEDEKMLDVSLKSLDPEGVRRLVARRRKFVTPEVTDDLDRMEGERLRST